MKITNTLSIIALFAVLNAGSLQAASETETTGEAEVTSETATEAGAATSETDAKDSEAERVVSETSMAITAQNDYIRKIMEKTTHIQAERLAEIMVEKGEANDIIFLDIRPRSEFAEKEGIPGVELNIPRNFLEVEAYEKLPDLDAPIIIISSKGIRGGLAAHTLTDMGYTDVRNLLGGLEAWNKMTEK